MIRVSYMGIPFSNSEEAAERFTEQMGWGPVELIPEVTSQGVVDSLTAGESDYGAVAFGNITAGPVRETELALAGRTDIETVAEITLPIHHCVFVRRGDAEVRALASHVQALMQTRANLRRLYPDAEWIETEDTAYAAELLAGGRLPEGTAVICRRNAGEHHGLELIHENIEDRSDNITAFILIRRV